jgi:hypothetical protein
MFRLIQPRSYDPVALHDVFNLVVIALLNVENLFYLFTGQVRAAHPAAAQRGPPPSLRHVGACRRQPQQPGRQPRPVQPP